MTSPVSNHSANWWQRNHERSSTTLDLYTRRTDDPSRVLRALDDEDPDDGMVGALVPR